MILKGVIVFLNIFYESGKYVLRDFLKLIGI